MHSSEYRNPDSLPPGSVLVVGAGNSGAQIALELAQSGRPTWLSGRDTGSIPRRVLGRDVYDWLWWTVLRPSVDSRVGRRLMGQMFAGDPLVGFSRRALIIPTLTSVGRTVGVSNGHPPGSTMGAMLEDVRTGCLVHRLPSGFQMDSDCRCSDPEGYPEHRRGIVAATPGLGFVEFSPGPDRLVAARRCARGCRVRAVPPAGLARRARRHARRRRSNMKDL